MEWNKKEIANFNFGDNLAPKSIPRFFPGDEVVTNPFYWTNWPKFGLARPFKQRIRNKNGLAPKLIPRHFPWV